MVKGNVVFIGLYGVVSLGIRLRNVEICVIWILLYVNLVVLVGIGIIGMVLCFEIVLCRIMNFVVVLFVFVKGVL